MTLFNRPPLLRILPDPGDLLRPLPVLPPLPGGQPEPGSPVERAQLSALRVIAEHLQAQTAMLRVMVGPALDDAALAQAGVSLPTPLDLPIVRRATVYAAGALVRLPRVTPQLNVSNLGSGAVRLRVYGAQLPAPGDPVDATDPPPTDEITLGAGLTLDWSDIISRGFLILDAGTLQVIAR